MGVRLGGGLEEAGAGTCLIRPSSKGERRRAKRGGVGLFFNSFVYTILDYGSKSAQGGFHKVADYGHQGRAPMETIHLQRCGAHRLAVKQKTQHYY